MIADKCRLSAKDRPGGHERDERQTKLSIFNYAEFINVCFMAGFVLMVYPEETNLIQDLSNDLCINDVLLLKG